MGNKVSTILTRGFLGMVCAFVALAGVGAFLGYANGVGARPNVPPGVLGAVVGALSFLGFFWPIAAVIGFVGGIISGLAIEVVKSAASNRRQ
jgi:hypothetical protein